MAGSNITKKALVAALKELTEEMTFDKITVGHICNKCEMNRKSFYYHFKDKYDLVEWIYYTEFVGAMRKKTYSDSRIILLDICLYFEKNRKFYRKVLKYDGQNSFFEYFRQLFVPLIEKRVFDIFENDENSRFYTAFFTDAFVNAIKKWLIEPEGLSAENFVSLIYSCVQGVVRESVSKISEEEKSTK